MTEVAQADEIAAGASILMGPSDQSLPIVVVRGLDFAGKQQGTTGEQMAEMVKGMVPILLAQAKLGALQNQVSEAVNAFIDDPKNITITAGPEKEVPFPMIMGAAMGAPETVPELLGVSVTANEE